MEFKTEFNIGDKFFPIDIDYDDDRCFCPECEDKWASQRTGCSICGGKVRIYSFFWKVGEERTVHGFFVNKEGINVIYDSCISDEDDDYWWPQYECYKTEQEALEEVEKRNKETMESKNAKV